MKKYLLSVCIMSLLGATNAMASTPINGEDYISGGTFDGLEIGPQGNVHLCQQKDNSCINKISPFNVTIKEDLAINGGSVEMKSASIEQTEENRTQGVVLKNQAKVTMEHSDIISNSRLELNSGSSLNVGGASSLNIHGNKTNENTGNQNEQTITPGEIKIQDGSSVSLRAGELSITENGETVKIMEDTTVNGNSILNIDNSSLLMRSYKKDGVTLDTNFIVTDDITISQSNVQMEGPALNILKTTQGNVIITDSAIIGQNDCDNNTVVASENLVVSNNVIPVIELPPEETQGDSETNTENNTETENGTEGGTETGTETGTEIKPETEESAPKEPVTNNNNALMNVTLVAGKNMTLDTRGTNVNALAGKDMTIDGTYVNLNAKAGTNGSGNVVINADINGGSLEAATNIDYQTGNAVLSGLKATQTTIQKDVDVTLSYGVGGGDVIVYGTLTMNNFKLTQGTTNNINVINSKLNTTWNNEIAGNLILENSKMTMKKDNNSDGWVRVGDFSNTANSNGNVIITNSIVDIDTSYIEASGTVNIDSNSKITIRISGEPIANKSTYGHIIADTLNIENGAKMVLTVDGDAVTKGKTLNYELFDANTQNGSIALQQNSRYTYVDKGDGTYDITLNKTASDMAGEQTGSEELSGMAGSLLDGAASDNKFVQHLNELSQTPGREKDFADGLEILAPSMAAYVSALATDTTRQIYNVIGDRFDRDSYRSRRTRTSMPSNSLWAQGLVSSAEFEGARAFETESKGGAIGFDVDPCHGCRVGLGYAYTMSDITSKGREIDVDSHTAIVYADLQSDPMFFNVIASYTRSMYNESKDVIGLMANADYDVDVLAAQAMLGYDMGAIRLSRNWRTGSFIPQIGFRYMNIKQKGYTDSADQMVSDAEAQTMTGIAGLHYTADYKMGPVIFYPDLHAAITYDFVSDELSATSSLAGSNPYTITAERLDELGVELGAEVGLRIANRVDIALSYLGMFRKDYTNHTGFANLRYRF